MSTLVVNRINAKTGSVLTVDALVTGSSVQAKGIIAASGSLYAGSLISGSGDLIVAKNAFIAGNLRVTGTVVTDTLDVRVINNSTVTTTTLEVEDKLIIVASGSNSSNTDDAGIQFGGTEGSGPIASILWDHTNQRLSASSALYTGGDVFVDGGDVTVKAGENGAANLLMQADESDDLGDDWKLTALANQSFQIANDKSGAYVTQLTITPDSGGGTADSVTKVGKLKLAGNVIQASDGGATITLDTSDNVTVAGDLTVTGADVTIGADSDGTDRTVTFGHSTLKTIMGIDDSADTFIINTDASFDGTVANNSLTIDASHNVGIAGDLTVYGRDITLGSDADGTDTIIVFGHSTLKSAIGIDDSQDVFAINTNATLDDTNDLEIDSSGNVTLSNGNLTVAGDVTVTGADVTLGADSDGTDRTITFGHSTLKTIMGIDDSADTFIINTDASFDSTLANNSLTIDASHNVGIAGALTIAGDLTVSGGDITIADTANIKDASGHVRMTFTDSGDTQFNDEAGNAILYVDTNQKVGVGTNSPDWKVEIASDSSNDATFAISQYQNTAGDGPNIIMRKARGTESSPTVVSEGDSLGAIDFYGYNDDGTNFDWGARIVAEVDGTPSTSTDTSDMPGRLAFYTSPDGSSTATEKMRIDNAGNVGVGRTPVDVLHVEGLISGSSMQTKGIIAATGSLYAGAGIFGAGTSNAQTMNTVTLPANYNSVLYGPITIGSSETVRISVGSNVKIVDIANV